MLESCSIIAKAVENDRSIRTDIQPLLELTGCSPPRSRFLVTKHGISLCLLVTSHPEHQIRTISKKNDLVAITKQLNLDGNRLNKNIQAFSPTIRNGLQKALYNLWLIGHPASLSMPPRSSNSSMIAVLDQKRGST